MSPYDHDPPSPLPWEGFKRSSGILILLLGQAGAGKSHFINSAAGRNIAPVRHGLTTQVFDVQCYSLDNPHVRDPQKPRSNVILVDTPGLNNGNARYSDFEIIRRISVWLNDNCDHDVLVGGIIFLHDIAEDRATVYADEQAWPVRHLDSQALLQHLVLATGKWDMTDVKGNRAKYTHREQKLKATPAWRRLLSRGALSCRYEGDHESAWNAINHLLGMDALSIRLLQKDFSTIQSKIIGNQPRPPLLNSFKALLGGSSVIGRGFSLTLTGHDEEGRKVIVTTAGSVEILNGSASTTQDEERRQVTTAAVTNVETLGEGQATTHDENGRAVTVTTAGDLEIMGDAQVISHNQEGGKVTVTTAGNVEILSRLQDLHIDTLCSAATNVETMGGGQATTHDENGRIVTVTTTGDLEIMGDAQAISHDQEGGQVMVTTAGNVEILSRSQDLQIDTVCSAATNVETMGEGQATTHDENGRTVTVTTTGNLEIMGDAQAIPHDQEGGQVAVTTAGNVEILSRSQDLHIDTLTVTSARGDAVSHHYHYNFYGPVEMYVRSDDTAAGIFSRSIR